MKIREYNQYFSKKEKKRFKQFIKVRDEHLRFKNREISHKSTEVYRKSCIPFIKFLAKKTHKNSFKAVSNKTLQEYVNIRGAEVSTTTLKRELSGIRKLLNNVGTHKNIASSNKDFNIENRSYITRTSEDSPPVANKKEFSQTVQTFLEMGDSQSSNIIRLEGLLGLRVEEATALSKQQLIQAVNENQITLYNTKGGKTRTVDVSRVAHSQIEKMLKYNYQHLKHSEKLFTQKSGDHKKIVKSIQNKVYLHRDKITDQKITNHSFRRYYANQTYERVYLSSLKEGLSKVEAKENALLYTSHQMGHNRSEITKIYLR